MTQNTPTLQTPAAPILPSKEKTQRKDKKDPEEAKRTEMMQKVSLYIATPKQNFVWQICMTQYNVILLTSNSYHHI
jgi:hypothetical protein